MARARTRPFSKSVGTFYFKVKTNDMSITIHRNTLDAARKAFLNYINQGKDCEWLGKWTGKKFQPVDEALMAH